MKRLKNKIIPQAAYLAEYITSGTLRLTVENEEQIKINKESGKSVIFAFWHGQLWLPAYYFRGRGYVGLASRSRDGGYISSVLDKFGWEMVRGSTSRGGARSLLGLIKKIKLGKNIAMTPDGPRGPRCQAQAGIVYLAQKTDSVIIPGGVAFSKKITFNSWDKFELPLPLSKGALFFEKGIEVPNNINADDIDYYTELVAKGLDRAVLSARESLGERI